MERAMDYIFSQLNKQDQGMDFLASQISKRLKAQDIFNKRFVKYVNRQFRLSGLGFILTSILAARILKRLDILEAKSKEDQ